jgi:hypothetical protein
MLEFDAYEVDNACDHYGSASGSVPQPPDM